MRRHRRAIADYAGIGALGACAGGTVWALAPGGSLTQGAVLLAAAFVVTQAGRVLA